MSFATSPGSLARVVHPSSDTAIDRLKKIRAVYPQWTRDYVPGHIHGLQLKVFLKRPVAVDMDPLSLLSRLAMAVPPPRRHTVRYAGILAPASKLRPQIIPSSPVAAERVGDRSEEPAKRAGSRYRPGAELLKRCFAIDVLACPRCVGRMRLVALVTEAASVRRFLRGFGEAGVVSATRASVPGEDAGPEGGCSDLRTRSPRRRAG